MSQVKVVPLDVTQNIDRMAVGSKAMSLVLMNRIGLPVPPGFCVLGTAFREHLEENNLFTRIKPTVDELGTASPTARRSLLVGIRQAIIEAPLAEHLRNEIENHHRMLGADRVAVRSSATVEDLPGHSFAGQYDTYLGVADLVGCLEAIKKCWASLWTERAYDYRERNGFDHLSADMAVIVQGLVPAEASGVLFTADPVTGRSDRLIIEACFGMGEALVSGKVTLDRFLLSKRDLRVLSHSVSEKAIQSVLDGAGGVVEQAVDPNLANTHCINETIARRLGALAKKAEFAFGSPQDMEWAVKGAELLFLQSRPITTLPSAKSWEDQQVWTNANTGEVLPDVVTPMSWSMASMLVMAIFNFVPDAVEESVELLTGLAVSPGVVTGPARVILRANTDEQVLAGEILVAPFTDPGWTPYFLPTAAIVMDQGGLLSHGSIVAREYGIPAVVNVGPATKIIQTGQTIQVDGNSGVVKIIR